MDSLLAYLRQAGNDNFLLTFVVEAGEKSH